MKIQDKLRMWVNRVLDLLNFFAYTHHPLTTHLCDPRSYPLLSILKSLFMWVSMGIQKKFKQSSQQGAESKAPDTFFFFMLLV